MPRPADPADRRRALKTRYWESLAELEALAPASSGNAAGREFTELETLEYLLMQAIERRAVAPIARALMSEFGSLSAVLAADRRSLLAVPGVSVETYHYLKFVFDVGHLACAAQEPAEPSSAVRLTSVRAAAAYCARALRGRAEECLLQVLMGRDSQVISAFFVGAGGESEVGLAPELIVENAVIAGASGVVLAHNHPSGLTEPSRADVDSTRRLADLLQKSGVRLYEHFICAGTACRALFAGETINVKD